MKKVIFKSITSILLIFTFISQLALKPVEERPPTVPVGRVINH